MPRLQRHIGTALALGSLLLIGLLTLIPDPVGAARAAETPLWCLVCGSLGGVDVLLNILLFVPLGIGLGLAGFSWRRALVLAGLLSCGIELLQMKVVAGRDASLGDVLTNSIGGGLGALLAAHWRRLVMPEPGFARRLTLEWALFLFAVWMGTAAALTPTWPLGTPWYGQWAPELGHLDTFPGRPLLITAGGEPLLPGRPIDQGRLEDAIVSSPSLAFRAVLGDAPDGLAPVAAIHDQWRREVILLGQKGDELQFRVRMRATSLRLRNPIAALPGGMAGAPGDTVDAEAALRNGAFELASRNGNVVKTRRIPLTASWGWTMLLPWNYALGPEVHFLTALWVAGLLAVLAHWAWLAGGAARIVPPVVAVVILGAIPRLAGLPPVHWSEWMAAGVGIALGLLAASGAGKARETAG